MKYIDADRLRAEINSFMNPDKEWKHLTQEELSFMGRCKSYVFSVIDSLQPEQPDEVLIPKWCLENIENTLRIQHNINNDAKDGETCQDRNIKESLNCVRKLLNGEEITGRERSESLMKQPEVDLEKELADYCRRYYNYDYPKQAEEGTGSSVMPHIIEAAKYFYELGLNSK